MPHFYNDGYNMMIFDFFSGEHFVPNVMDWPDVGRWLSVTGYDRIAKDMDSVPEHIQSVFSDCCVCIYQQRPAYQ